VVTLSTGFWFWVCYAATQLALQLHQEHIQVLRSNRVARKRPAESNGAPAMDLGHMNVVLKWCVCSGGGLWNCNYYYCNCYCYSCHYCFFVLFPPFLLSFFFFFCFLKFIKCVYGLRWMCSGGGVAYYVTGTNVVKKW